MIQKYSFMWQAEEEEVFVPTVTRLCARTALEKQKPRTPWKTLLNRNKPLFAAQQLLSYQTFNLRDSYDEQC